MNNDMRIFVSEKWEWDALSLTFVSHNKIAKPLEWEERDPAIYPEPTITIPTETAQMLIDKLWILGYRPKEIRYATDALNLQSKHLEDMRNIAFKFLHLEYKNEKK